MAKEENTYPVKSRFSRVLNVLSVGSWATAVLAGMIWLQLYASTQGQSGPVPSLQSISNLPIDWSKPNLLIFVHPQCPCTRASLRELERLIAQAQGRLAVLSMVYTPSKLPSEWTDDAIREQLRSIPGLRVIEDMDGEWAHRFGARTSGWVILYNREGQRLYCGGITPQRGHEGDNPGSRAILDYLDDPNLPATQGRVFGCPIFGKNDAEEINVP